VQLTPAWTRELAGRRGVLEVLNPETLRTRNHPLLSEDHMVGHVHAEACCLKSAYGSIPRNAAKLILAVSCVAVLGTGAERDGAEPLVLLRAGAQAVLFSDPAWH
jgi:hypothetical protein